MPVLFLTSVFNETDPRFAKCSLGCETLVSTSGLRIYYYVGTKEATPEGTLRGRITHTAWMWNRGVSGTMLEIITCTGSSKTKPMAN